MNNKNSITLFILISLFVFQTGFSQKKQHLKVTGLKEEVGVLRDQWGVNHIYAQNQQDLFFAQGYLAAQDRLFQFEMWRRQATGTVAEIFGPKELKRDIGARLFKFRGDMNKELAHYHKDGRVIITSFVRGVNAYISHVLENPEELPVEFKLLNIQPGKWTPEVVISRHNGLKGNVQEELSIGRAVAEGGADQVKDLMWFHPKDPDIRLDPEITKEILTGDILALYNAYSRSLRITDSAMVTTNVLPRSVKDPEGSNNWIVSGSRTESGYPILANDPHRSIALPSLRYMVHLNAPGWNVIGGGEPEIPGVSIGHNDYGAWGLTIFETDAEDLYVYDVNPGNRAQYKYKGKWVDMEEIEETIPVRGEEPYTATLRYTKHGPVTFIDSTHNKAFAVKAGWLEVGAAPYLAALRYDQVKNWRQFRKASEYNLLPGENMIWADKKGHIGWQVVGISPVRKNNHSGLVPVPGDGRFDWSGYLHIKKRPHALNPVKGYFATANQSVTPEDYKHWNSVGYTWADDFRGDRINEVLEKDKNRNLEKEKSLQTDYLSLPARTLTPMLRPLQFEDQAVAEAQQKLKDWDYVLDKESVAAAIYVMWERKIFAKAYQLFVPENLQPYIGDIQLTKIISWLQHPEEKFSKPYTGERDQFLVQTFEEAVESLQKKLGDDMTGWQYGQEDYKQVTLYHPLHQFLPEELQKKYSLGPLPRGGYSFVPNSTGYSDNQYSGASFRMLTDLSDWDKTLMINTPGQSANPDSKYYGNLFELWAQDQYFNAYFSKQKILNDTDVITVMQPSIREK